jgi:hypothetical protein
MRILALLALCGCSLIGVEHSNAPEPADDWADRALPAFSGCRSCHASGTIGFLAGDDPVAIRTTILSWQPPVIDLANPLESRVFDPSIHPPESLDAQQVSDVLTWILAEREAD